MQSITRTITGRQLKRVADEMYAFATYATYFYIFCASCAVAFTVVGFVTRDQAAMQEGFIHILAFFAIAVVNVWTVREKSMVYDVDPNKLLVGKGETFEAIAYSEIESVSFPRFGAFGHWMTMHLSAGRKIRLFQTMDRPDYVLDTVMRARPDLVDEKQALRVRERIILLSHVNARANEAVAAFRKFKGAGADLVAMFALSLLLVVGAAVLRVKHIPVDEVFLLAVHTWFLRLAISEVSSYLTKRKQLRADVNDVRRDIQHEILWVERGQMIAWMAYVAGAFALFASVA